MEDERKRKEAFFEELYHLYDRKLLRQANAYFGYQKPFFHLAEDAVQETFFQAFEAYDTLRTHPNPEAWLSVVLRRRLYLCGKEVENLKRLTVLDENTLPLPIEEQDEMEKFFRDEENRDLVSRLMKPLKPKEKRLLRLFYTEQKSSAEIASMMGTSDRVINTQLYRIRKNLRKIFESGIFLLIYAFFFHI